MRGDVVLVYYWSPFTKRGDAYYKDTFYDQWEPIQGLGREEVGEADYRDPLTPL